MVAKNAVLVTGAGGFVGSAVVRALLSGPVTLWNGSPLERVIAVLRPGGSPYRLEGCLPSSTCSLVEADVTDPRHVAAMIDEIRPRAVVHAAMDRRINETLSESEIRRFVLDPIARIAHALARVGDHRFVHTGSSWVLGPGECLDESADLDPRSPYAIHKARADELVSEMGAGGDVRCVNLRLFNLFGRYEAETRLLPHMVSRLTNRRPVKLSSGERIRDFTDVDDMARAYVRALEADVDAEGTVYHIGSGRGTTIRDFAFRVADVTGGHDLIEFSVHDVPDGGLEVQVADPRRAREVLGWEASRIDDAIQTMVKWWLERWGLERPPLAEGEDRGLV